MDNFTPEKVRWILIDVFVLLISVAFHEFGHAIVAYKLGDDTPKRQGRVTLNPIAHADPIGTLLLPLIGGIYAAAGGLGGGFGWGKPVQWQPHRVTRKVSMAVARIMVAVAGPLMNLLLGTLLAGIHAILIARGVLDPYGEVSRIFFFAVTTNYILLFFNLLPVPPLDGGHVAQSFMPYRHREKFDNFARFGPFIILGFMLIPQMQQVFVVPAMFIAKHVYSLFGVL
jgi:Zn-dependent protease